MKTQKGTGLTVSDLSIPGYNIREGLHRAACCDFQQGTLCDVSNLYLYVVHSTVYLYCRTLI